MKRVLVLAMAATAAASFGQSWAEVPDAGGLPGTANMTMGAGNLATITGDRTTPDLEDMFCIRIVDEAIFSASTVGGATWDTQLFLFDAAGMGVVFNDDAGPLQSTIDSTLVTTNGLYYLAISGYDHDPVSAGGAIFPDTPFGSQNGPTGPGGGAPISGWDTTAGNTGGTYTIALTGATYCMPVPEPGTMIALFAGLGAIAARRRRK